MTAVHQISKLLVAAFILATASSAIAADDGAWTVSKSSGEVWLSSTGAQPASLTPEETLKPGDTVRTGRTGRVLLQRGEETILISPNSIVGLPTEKKDGLATTILQQAGSILLEVEKRNVKHFEVETPYLAAVVKGTQFRVTVNAASTSVEVTRGQVEVADFRSGQIAQVLPGQHATTFAQGKPGLTLGGSGTFNPIEQGKPRAASIERVPVPKTGLTAPRNAANGSIQHGRPASIQHGQTRRHAHLVVDRRSPAEFPPGHARPRPRQFSGLGHIAKRCEQGHDLEFVRLWLDHDGGRDRQQSRHIRQCHCQQRQYGDERNCELGFRRDDHGSGRDRLCHQQREWQWKRRDRQWQ